jgi:hypothetical protein
MRDVLKYKLQIFLQRLLGVFLACMFWMVQGDLRLLTTRHWITGLQTAFASAIVPLALSSTSCRIVFEGRYRKFVATAVVVALVDHLIHPSHFGGAFGEAVITGLTAAGLLSVFGVIVGLFS